MPSAEVAMKNVSLRRNAAGFTLIEVMCAVAVVSVLSSVAYPGYQAAVQKVRRSDGRLALMQVQMAQERFRADHIGYADSLTDIGVAANSPSGHYRLAVAASAESSFQIDAIAQGAQRSDSACRYLRVTVAGANAAYASGADAGLANPDADNRRCWSL
jgi:type IV pilus assembly protein PilE